MPSPFIPPMIPRLVTAPPTGADWRHEVKFDGFRAQAHIADGDVTIYSRNGVDFTHRFRQLLPTLAALPCRSAIVDGEIIAYDRDGKPDFAALMRKGPRPAVCLVAFDMLALDGVSLVAEPIETRHAALTRLLGGVPRDGVVMISETFEDATTLLEACERLELEGIVSKRRGSRYRSGPAHTWLKVKTQAWRTARRRGTRQD